MENETQYVSIINGYTIKDKETREIVNEALETIDDSLAKIEPLPHKCLNYAHRGLSCEAPENTLVAFYKAGYHGCYGIEIDIQMTSDNKIVVMHDETVDRTTNGSGTVNALTSEYIRSLEIDAGNNVNKFSTQQVPFLYEALDICNRFNMIPMLELKAYWTDSQLQILLDMLKEYKLINTATIIGFDINQLRAVRQLNSSIKLAFLSSSSVSSEMIENVTDIKKCGLSLYYSTNSNISDELISLMRTNEIEYGFWTMNNQSDVTNILNNNSGTSFIVSDYGFGGAIKPFTKMLVGLMTEDGFINWAEYSPTSNIGIIYDDFSITKDGTNYTVTFTTPLTVIGTNRPSIVTGTIIGLGASKYTLVCRSQTDTDFIFNIYDNSTGDAVTLEDVFENYSFYLNFVINGYA